MGNVDFMIDELIDANKFTIDKTTYDKKVLLKTLMTLSTADLSEDYYKLEKDYLLSQRKEVIDIDKLNERLVHDIYIYKGDITGIKADAIVNAANEKLLGCFIPGHHCIDNAIHLGAGLQLRQACRDIMTKQGHDEMVGQAKITSGYNLPSKYVIHTVGPKYFEDHVEDKLKACYQAILEAADAHAHIKNLVFCSISTGVYGVKINIAAKIALRTISDYMNDKNKSLEKVVIDVFSQEDYDEYKHQSKFIK